MSDFSLDLPEHIRILQESLRRFVAEEIRPVEMRLDPEARAIPAAALAPLQEKAKKAGFWCLDAPTDYGGAGLSSFEFVVAVEEASKHKFCFPQPGGGVFGHPPPIVLYAGSKAQIEKYVVQSMKHGWYGFTAIAEPTGGTDPARAIRTTARREGDRWILNGTKMWITHGEYAKYGVVYARTERGISAIIVDAGTRGMEVVRSLPVLRDHWPTEIRFEECAVPAENLIGEEGKGLELAGKWVQRARLLYAARSIGVAEEAIRMGTEWARERSIFGASLATRQATQFAIADSRVEIDAARWLVWQTGWKHDQGRDIRADAAAAKLYAVEAASRTVDRMIQIMGAMGLSKELPLEAWYRDLRVARILEGSSEILRTFIARSVIGPAASGKGG
jgi:acyl-CoA dehydrogenase